MPFVTFSRNFKKQKGILKVLRMRVKDANVEPRGTKTVKKIAQIAYHKGFKDVLIIDSIERTAAHASHLKLKMEQGGITWKFSGRRAIRLQSLGSKA
ncbi:MAG: hypothetical protein M1504_01625 [Candidatus Marsarchaeota archaeon]|nr:hypothetical protein [Candidatus Marsarchaeota archaeon]